MKFYVLRNKKSLEILQLKIQQIFLSRERLWAVSEKRFFVESREKTGGTL